MIDEQKAVDNINEFFEEHGSEGFLKLFFKEYLFNLIDNEISSKGNEISEDFGILHYKGNQLKTKSERDEYSKQIKEECDEKAEEIVDDLKKDTNLLSLLNGDFDQIDNELYDDYLKEALHDLFKKWEEKDEG